MKKFLLIVFSIFLFPVTVFATQKGTIQVVSQAQLISGGTTILGYSSGFGTPPNSFDYWALSQTLNVNSPWNFNVDLWLKPTSGNTSDYDYVYISGYSGASRINFSSPMCEVVSNTNNVPTQGSNRNDILTLNPFTLKCNIKGNTGGTFLPFTLQLIGSAYSENSVTYQFTLYLFNSIYFTSESSKDTATAIQEQTQVMQQEMNELQQKQEETNQKLEDLNDTLTSGDVDSPDSSFDEFKGMLAQNGVITDLVTMPITLFSSILNSVNSSCNTFNLGNLLGTDLVLPCINVSNYLGNTLWSVIDILFSGFFIFTIGKKFIETFNKLSSMEEGDILD